MSGKFIQRNESFLTVKDVQKILGTLLYDCLGRYHFKGGHSRVAIGVNKRDDNVRVEGLELLLKPFPTSIDRNRVWGFFLVQHTPGSEAMYYAQEKINCSIRRGNFSRIINQNYELKQLLQSYNEIPLGELYALRVELNIQ